MKILKIFGIVVGIHLFALIVIFANPGCTSKPAPSLTDSTPPKASEPAAVVAPTSTPIVPAASSEPATTSSAITFNPNLPATAAPSGGGAGMRTTPTRPNTPVAGVLLAEPVADVTPATTYIVKSGDNLWTIASKNNISVAQLTAANRLSSSAVIQPGQKLIIPGKSTSGSAGTLSSGGSGSTAKAADPLAAATSRAGTDTMKHVVKSGETLGGIAIRYGVSIGDIAIANSIVDPARIRPGMELVIPGWQATGAKSGKSTKSKNGAAKSPALNSSPVVEPLPPATPAPPPPVPVIPIDESAGTPAPKQP